MISILWFASVFGMSLIVARGAIFAPLRAAFPKPQGEVPFFGTLVRCVLCFAFWAGALHYAAGFRVFSLTSTGAPILDHLATAFLHGTAGAGGAWFLFLLCESLGQSDFLDRD